MTVKLSPHKVSTILRYYFAGVSQTNIARRVRVDQSTVSLHSSRFQSMAAKNGISHAAKEFGIMQEVNDLRSLSVELLKNKLTIEEAREGLVTMKTFNSLGVPISRHKELVNVVSKLQEPDFVPVAMELVDLERSTGKVYTQVVSEFRQLRSEMGRVERKISVSKRENDNLLQSNKKLRLTIREKQRELRDLNKKAHREESAIEADMSRKMEVAELTFQRIEKLETLLRTLKKLSVSDEQMEQYICKHVDIEESGIGWENFTNIIQAAAIEGGHVDCEKLKECLGKYISLVSITDALEEKKSTLESEVCKLSVERNKLEASVNELRQQKKGLELKSRSRNKTLAKLDKDYRLSRNELNALQGQLSQITISVGTLEAKHTELERGILQYEEKKSVLSGEVKSMEEIVERQNILEHNITVLKTTEKELQGKTKREARRLEVLDAFLGLIHAANREDLQGFARVLPTLLKEAYKKNYSTYLLLKFVFQQLSGKAADGLSCTNCGTAFVVNKQPARMFGYQCPVCGSLSVSTNVELWDILRDRLSPTGEKTDGTVTLIPIRVCPIDSGKKQIDVLSFSPSKNMRD